MFPHATGFTAKTSDGLIRESQRARRRRSYPRLHNATVSTYGWELSTDGVHTD